VRVEALDRVLEDLNRDPVRHRALIRDCEQLRERLLAEAELSAKRSGKPS
jgi:ribosomal 50S subunit-associated protein YjgA (DUF615 family)